MVEDGAEELEDLVHFSVSELPSRGYGGDPASGQGCADDACCPRGRAAWAERPGGRTGREERWGHRGRERSSALRDGETRWE